MDSETDKRKLEAETVNGRDVVPPRVGCPTPGCEFLDGHQKDTPCGWRVKAAENSPAPHETNEGPTKPNEPTLTCSEVVERLDGLVIQALEGRISTVEFRKEATAILHSWRERRVQELEEALREMVTEVHLCCCGGETHANCPKNKAHNFLACKLCKAESLVMTDPIPHKADCVLSDEWREQISKLTKRIPKGGGSHGE